MKCKFIMFTTLHESVKINSEFYITKCVAIVLPSHHFPFTW